MYYHIQITTKENEKINKFDVVDLEYIKSNILIPYLKGNHSNLAGYVIAAADVKRIDVTKSKDKSSECVNIADSKRPLSATTTILPETCVFDNENFSTDITDELLDELRKNTSIIKSPSVFDLASKISGFSDEFLELKRTVSMLTKITKTLLDQKAARKFLIYKCAFSGIVLFYYGVIILSLLKWGLETMHPILVLIELGFPVVGLILFAIWGKEFKPTTILKSKRKKILLKVYQKHGFVENPDVVKQNTLQP